MQGWKPLENSPYVITEEGEIAQRIADKEPKPSPNAVEFEMATGEKSAQRIAQERGHEIIKNVKSWGELHEGLKKIGLRFEKKGSGAIIWVGETTIKASSVDRSLSMGKLVKRLGEFVIGEYETAKPKDDVSPENVVRLQKDGYKPAAIIESSPCNFQCVLTIPKFGGEFDRQIANQLAAMLNKEYGDPNLSGAINPHRAPGFANRKPKHRQKDGSYPLSQLRFAVQQIRKKALVEARKLEQAFMAKMKQRQKTVFAPTVQTSPQAAYFAHYENIRAHYSGGFFTGGRHDCPADAG